MRNQRRWNCLNYYRLCRRVQKYTKKMDRKRVKL